MSVCNHTRNYEIGLPRFLNHLYDYRTNWAPLSPLINIYSTHPSIIESFQLSFLYSLFYTANCTKHYDTIALNKLGHYNLLSMSVIGTDGVT